MDFTREEWETILAAIGGPERLVVLLRLLCKDEGKRAMCALSGGLGTREKITALIERIEQEGQR